MNLDLTKAYNRNDFTDFLYDDFLPEDFQLSEEPIYFDSKKLVEGWKLGSSDELDLTVYEFRTNLSDNRDPRVTLTREVAKIMKEQDSNSNALVVFYSDASKQWRLSLITTDFVREDGKIKRLYSNPRRFSFLLGTGCKKHTPESMLSKKVISFDDLKKRFDVEVVNKEFYSKIAGLFYRFIDEAKYPNADRKKFFAVKLIGRIIFCWFLKKKKSDSGKPLMPEELLSLESLKKHQNYFHSVLEPLFFEVLNTPVEKRTSAALLQIEDFAKSIPFLNGGLFEPDDDDKYQGTASYGVIEIADSWFHDLFELLEMYNFTINENTPVDVELSIDPEMLGRIFENLLAEINPETGESARKATGSFYTPREIVEYMVNESLKAYLLQKVEIDEETVDKLLNWSEEAPELSKSQSNEILEALDTMKVLDPACGSGAFPMGILQKTALVLEKIDPQSINWIVKIIEKIDNPMIKKMVEDQLQKEDWSYVHKLGIIQKSIYGVDIQPIAVEISKLRFFLSLIIDCKIDDKEENRGVKPLPNLETKFVCANTLIGLESNEFDVFIEQNPDVAQTKQELFLTRRAYFGTQTKEEKEKIKAKDKELNQKLFRLVSNIYASTTTAAIQKLVAWNPYKHNEVAPFFDPEWMFGVKNGFDAVIGNPPYVQLQNNGGELAKIYEKRGYASFAKTGDIYCLFYELGSKLLKKGGNLCFITSNKWMRAGYGEKLRDFFAKNVNPKLLVDFAGVKVFDTATVDTNILLFENGKNEGKTQSCIATSLTKDGLANLSDFVRQNSAECAFSSNESWVILSPIEQSIKKKIESVGVPLKNWDISINYGIKTGFNDAFIINGSKRNEILANCKTDEERKRTEAIIRPILRGRDIKRYSYEYADLYLIATFPSKHYDIEKYPAVKEYLLTFGMERLEQTGKEYKINGEKIKARKKTNNKWFETQDSISYWEDFDKPKIVWGEISDKSKFAFDFDGIFMPEATSFYMNGEKIEFLFAALNSSLSEWFFSKIGTTTGVGTVRWKKYTIEQLLVAKPNEKILQDYLVVFNEFKSKNITISDFSAYSNKLIFSLYGLTEEEIKYVENR